MRTSTITLMRLSALCFLAILLAGCPVGLDYPVDEIDRNAVETKLVGTWETDDPDADILKMRIEKASDKMLLVHVLEQGENYMHDGTAFYTWTTKIQDHRIAYARAADDADSLYYHYHFTLEGNQLVISDMSLLVGGKDAVTSTAALRQEVIGSMGKEEWLSSSFRYKRQ